MRKGIDIRLVANDRDIQAVRSLFSEYQQWLGVDLCFQGFAQELADLPGDYTAPSGCLFLACDGNQYAGVVGVRLLAGAAAADACEMKRLYVRTPWRGAGVGRALSEAAIKWARKAGYERICLDTLERLTEARALYASQGFHEIAAYYENPLESPIYMECKL